MLIFIVYILLYLSRFIDGSILTYGGNVYLSFIVIQLLVFAIPGFFYIKLKGIEKDLHLKHILPRDVWFIISTFFVLIFGSTLMNTFSYYVFGSDGQYSITQTYVTKSGSTLFDIAYTVVAFVIIPALVEEFIFRGIVLSEYASYGKFTAIVMSSVMFGMLHFNLKQLLTYVFCGVVVSYAVYVTQSLWAGILLHVFNNLYAVFFESKLWDMLKKPNSIVFFIFVVTALLALFLIFSFNSAENILYNLGTKGVQSPPEANKQDIGMKPFLESIVSPCFIGCVIFFLVVTLVLK